jgi:hypothetical protein
MESLRAQDYAVRTAEGIYIHRFPGITELSFPPITDLSLLAHALDRRDRARDPPRSVGCTVPAQPVNDAQRTPHVSDPRPLALGRGGTRPVNRVR